MTGVLCYEMDVFAEQYLDGIPGSFFVVIQLRRGFGIGRSIYPLPPWRAEPQIRGVAAQKGVIEALFHGPNDQRKGPHV